MNPTPEQPGKMDREQFCGWCQKFHANPGTCQEQHQPFATKSPAEVAAERITEALYGKGYTVTQAIIVPIIQSAYAEQDKAFRELVEAAKDRVRHAFKSDSYFVAIDRYDKALLAAERWIKE